jgi:hypothetical protein
VVGIEVAKRNRVKYLDDNAGLDSSDEEDQDATEVTSKDFNKKTSLLLTYIENTYLEGGLAPDPESEDLVEKMRSGEMDEEEKKVSEKHRYIVDVM